MVTFSFFLAVAQVTENVDASIALKVRELITLLTGTFEAANINHRTLRLHM